MYFWVKPEIKLGGIWICPLGVEREKCESQDRMEPSEEVLLAVSIAVVWQAYIALDLNSAIFVFMEIKDVLNRTPDSWTPYDYSLWSHVVREEGLKKWVVWHYLKKKLFQRQRKLLHNSGFITMRSHRRQRERQSGRKSFFSMWAGGEQQRVAAWHGTMSLEWWEHRGELKSGRLYGNELWRGLAATNLNA